MSLDYKDKLDIKREYYYKNREHKLQYEAQRRIEYRDLINRYKRMVYQRDRLIILAYDKRRSQLPHRREWRKKYRKQYYINNKNSVIKDYQIKNRVKILASKKEYHIKNREKELIYIKQYAQRPEVKERQRLHSAKRRQNQIKLHGIDEIRRKQREYYNKRKKLKT